jgi:hypothetical protein
MERSRRRRVRAALAQASRCRSARRGFVQSIDTDLVAEVWQQAVKVTKSYLQNELAKAQQPTIEGVHADLARCFMRHNDGAKLISQSSYNVALDVSKTGMWKDDQAPPPPPELPLVFKKIFTGNGVMEFFADDTEGMRNFLAFHGGVSDAELQFICDTWVERQWQPVGQWLHDVWFQGEYSPKEAPLLLIVIAELNPLTAVAKIIAACQGKYLFTGKAITHAQIVEVLYRWRVLRVRGVCLLLQCDQAENGKNTRRGRAFPGAYASRRLRSS